MNQTEPSGQGSPEIPQESEEKTSEDLAMREKETPSVSEEKKESQEPPVTSGMIIEEQGEEKLEKPLEEGAARDAKSSVIEEKDVSGSPLNTESQAYNLQDIINSSQEKS